MLAFPILNSCRHSLLRVAALFTLSVTAILATSAKNTGQADAPDFNFPKTVATNAEAAYKKAITSGDSIALVQSLIDYITAEELISHDNTQKCLDRLTQAESRAKGSCTRALIDLLRATVFYEYYSANKWTYNERKLPLRPVPADISMWSGQQFTDTISVLANDALKYAAALKTTPISAFGNVIKANHYTQIYYPTLYDFVVYKVNLLGIETSPEILSDLLKTHRRGSAPYMMYFLRSIPQLDADSMLNIYNQFRDSEYSGEILVELPQYNLSLPLKKRYAKCLYEYLAKYPTSFRKNELQNRLNWLIQKEATVSYPTNLLPAAHPVDINIKLRNTDTATLALYRIGPTTSQENIDIKKIIAREPLHKYQISADTTLTKPLLPFEITKTFQIILPSTGRYILAITSPASEATNPDYGEIICNNIFGLSVIDNESGTSYAISTHPFSGKPVNNANVTLCSDFWKNGKRSEKTAIIGETDSNGLLKFTTPFIENSARVSLLFKKGQDAYNTNTFWLPSEENPDKNYEYISASGYTSLAVYHPGDSVDFAFITEKANYVQSQPAANLYMRAILMDANNESVDTLECTTDNMGRIRGNFYIPDDRLTGRYYIRALRKYNNDYTSCGSVKFLVSDYKMPQFKTVIKAVRRNYPSDGDITIEGETITYSGFPVVKAKVVTSLQQRLWWWMSTSNIIAVDTTMTDNSGHFAITFGKDLFDKYKKSGFVVTADVTSATGETRGGQIKFMTGKPYSMTLGKVTSVDISKPFNLPIEMIDEYFSPVKNMDMKYTLKDSKSKEVISHGEFALNKPVLDLKDIPQGVYTLSVNTADTTLCDADSIYAIFYNPSAKTIPISSPLWLPKTKYTFNKKGEAEILVGVADSTSYIYVFVCDSDGNHSVKLHETPVGYNYINVKIPSSKAKSASVTMLCVRNTKIISHVLNIANPVEANGITLNIECFRDKLVPGNYEKWTFKTIDPLGNPVSSALMLDVYNSALETIQSHSFNAPYKYINDADKFYTAGEKSHIFNIYSCITLPKLPNNSVLPPYFNDYNLRLGFSSLRRSDQLIRMNSIAAGSEDYVEQELCETTTVTSQGPIYDYRAPSHKMAYNYTTSEIVEAADFSEEEEEGLSESEPKSAETESYRPAEMPLMMFMPMLETGDDGISEVGFVVPDANASWILRAIAYNDKMESAKLMREFTTSKPVMVAANAPRFLREGDRACILSSVMNATDSAVTVSVKTECFDPLSGLVTSQNIQTIELAASASTEITQYVEAPANITAIGFRIFASTGRFTDGEQILIAISPALEPVIESKPFYLAPGTTDYSLTVPTTPTDASVTLSYCDNPRWYIVSALPSLRQSADNDVFSAATTLYSVYLTEGLLKEFPQVEQAIEQWRKNPADSALASMLERNSELKSAMLKATPWMQEAVSDTERMQRLAMLLDRKELKTTADKALSVLEKMQTDQGGWLWYPQAREASAWTTSTVLRMFGYIRFLGYMPKNSRVEKMITNALAWLDNEQVKNYRKPKTPQPAAYIDYAMLRQDFADIPMTAATSNLVGDVVQYVVGKWSKLDLAQKPQAALILYRGGYRALSHKLLESMSQFSTSTPERGMWFPSFDNFKQWSAMSKLASTAFALEAFSLIEPQNKASEQLAQWLVLQKETLNWGNSINTSYVIASLLKAPSMQLAQAGNTSFTLADSILTPASIESLTGSFTMPLTPYSPSGKTLTLRRSGDASTQAFGSLLMRYKANPADVKAASVDGLSIEKRMLKRVTTSTGYDWVETDSLHTGDYVRTLLTIVTDRDLEYVIINDNRMAALEPVDQLPGYIYAEGVGLYRENRDEITNLFVSYLPKGSYQLSYDATVNNSGTFASGLATIQSQYAPAMTAHSSGKTVDISR